MANSGKTDKASKQTAAKHEALLETARKRFKLASDAENTQRENMLEDKKFAAGEHWPEKIRRERTAEGRPCLTIDRLKPQIKQVTNQQRAMRPAIQVSPKSGGARVETAEVLQGIVRHIETNSDADDAYDCAGKDQAEIGLGWFKVVAEYCDDETADQDLRIKRVRNAFSIYADPAAVERDRSDMMFLFETQDLEADSLKSRYPNAQHTSADEFQGLGDDAPHWMVGERIRVAKYWRVEITKTDTTLSDGRKRPVKRRRVFCDHITGLEVLESYEWAGKYIPYIPVIGEENDIEGKVDLRGMVRGAKDPQRMFNYWKSAITEAMALAPKAPFIAAEGQIEPYLKMWKAANVKNLPFLIYKPTTLAGSIVPPPQRQVAEPPIQAMLAETQGTENDIRASTGFSIAVSESEDRRMSGVAIRERRSQGDHGNSDYLDGLSRAVRFCARVLIDLIPKIYDTARVMRIVGKDNQPQTVVVHAGADNAPEAGELDPGVKGVFDLGVGTYDVAVSTGPNYQTAREEFIEVMSDLFKANPALFNIVGDLFFENLDIPNAKQVAERMKKTLPPGLQDDNAAIPPQAQAQIAQMQQQMQAMGAALQQAQQQIEAKQLELASKEKIAAAEIESKEKIAALNAEIAKHKATTEAQLTQIKLESENSRHAMSEGREAQAQILEHAHEAKQAAHAATRQIESQHTEHEHASMMQASKPQPGA